MKGLIRVLLALMLLISTNRNQIKDGNKAIWTQPDSYSFYSSSKRLLYSLKNLDTRDLILHPAKRGAKHRATGIANFSDQHNCHFHGQCQHFVSKFICASCVNAHSVLTLFHPSTTLPLLIRILLTWPARPAGEPQYPHHYKWVISESLFASLSCGIRHLNSNALEAGTLGS